MGSIGTPTRTGPERGYRIEHPFDTVLCCLRARRKQRGGLPSAEDGVRGVAGRHGPLQQPHRVRSVARSGARRRGRRRHHPRHRGAGRAAELRRRVERLPGRRVAGGGRSRGGRQGKEAKPRGRLLLRPRDGRRGARLLREAWDTGIHQGGHGVGGGCLTPNQFELEFLTCVEVGDLDDALAAADKARRLGPETVLTTSLRRRDADADTIEMLAVSKEGAWLVQTPMLALEVNGAGDATAALFLAHLLRGAALAEALSMTASAVYAVLEETRRTGSREMRLVSAQESFGEPPHRFESRRIR